MAGDIDRRPAAGSDLIEIWLYSARDDEGAADRVLDRIELALQTLAARPLLGRVDRNWRRAFDPSRSAARSGSINPIDRGIDLVRVLGGAMDIRSDDVT